MELQNEFLIFFIAFGLVFLAVMYFLYTNQSSPLNKDKDKSYIGLFAALSVIGIGVRIIIAYSMPGYESDMNCFRSWADLSYSGGYANFYSGEFFADYPPLYIYVLSFLGWIRDISGISSGSPEFGLIIKMPSLIMDIVLGAMIYSLARREINARAGIFLSALILLNPAVMVNSAVWGQVDVITTVLMVLVIYLLYKDRLIWSAVAFILALLLKPQAIMLAPVMLFVFVRNIIIAKEKKKPLLELLISLGAMAALFFLVPLPFGINKEPLWLVERYMDTMGQYPYATLNAFNIYGLAGINFKDATEYSFLSLTLNNWGFIFIAAICVYAFWLYIKKPDKPFLFAIAAFIILAVFTFAHGMHERYIFVVPVLMLIAYIFLRDKRLFACTLMVFGMQLVNIAVSLYYYQVYIPETLTVLLSAAALGIYVYTMYVITMIALYPPILQKQRDRLAETPGHKLPEQLRLENFGKGKNVRITRWDALIMLAISAAYAVVAFTNLGATKIPENAATLNRSIVIKLGGETTVDKFKYYAGFGSGEFSVYASNDGETYRLLGLTEEDEVVDTIIHERGYLYKWREYDDNITATHIMLQPSAGELPILEMALYDGDGKLIVPQSVYDDDGAVTELFDEQELVPEERTYMTDFYFDELYHVRTAYEHIHGIQPYEVTHPPLGKIIIASGIELFGMNPFGWRFMGTLAGVLMLPVIYIIGKLMLKKTKYAALAAILFAVDFMHFAQTRIGTVDSYSILWIMLMYLFMYKYTQTNFNVQPLKKTLPPLFLCGLFFGIGAATKWLCIYAGLGLLAIFLFTMYRRYKEYAYAKDSDEHRRVRLNYRRKLATTLLCCVGFFIIIPAAIYLCSYAPYFMVTEGNAYTGLDDILKNQSYMLNYHSTLKPDHVHPFSSMWYSWPFDVRPVLFFSQQNAVNNTTATLSTMGNPILWWSGVVASVYILYTVVKQRKRRIFELMFLAIALLSQYMPWWFISREVFIYHYFASVPFLILIIVYFMKFIDEEFKYGKYVSYALTAACIAAFVFFYPVITGVPANSDYVEGLRWLDSWPFY